MEEDQDYVQRTLDGDISAYTELVRMYEPVIRAFLASHLQAGDEISELTQQTFIAAYRKLSSYRHEGNFGFWLKAIARNAMRMHFRSNSRRRNALSRFREEIAEEVHHDLNAMAQHDHQVVVGNLRDCVEKLSPRMRDAVHKRYYLQQSMIDVAESLRIKANALSALLFRARRNLKACMDAIPEA